jgi:ubiquitin-conjugating enzyme E2 G1
VPGSEGGMFKAKMQFPEDFPNSPPELRFTSQFWHPNVHKEDGKVCISILHPPGDDPHHYELAEERWRPIHSIESVLLSVIAMISDPNDESPANVDAAKQWRDNPDEYKKVVGRLVRRSQEEAFD